MRGPRRPLRHEVTMTLDAKKIKDRANLDVLMHVPLSVTAELGSCKMEVAEVLKLGAGSIIELDRLAGGPVDLLVNNKLIARGEVVAVDENSGGHITEPVPR